MALIVLVPVACVNMWFGSHFGILVTSLQPMKISAAEAQWDDCQKCAFSLFQIGGFTESDETPSFSIEIPGLLSYLSTGSFNGKVDRADRAQPAVRAAVREGQLLPPIEAIYWSMRGMAYAGVARRAGRGRRRVPLLETQARAAQLVPVGRRGRRAFLPFVACIFGWCLTEIGRQPWIVQGLLKTAKANSPSGQHDLARDQPGRLRRASTSRCSWSTSG